MKRQFFKFCLIVLAVALAAAPAAARAQHASFAKVSDEVNKKLVKIYGRGGFKNLASYGTGIVVSPQGHVLTVASPLLDDENLHVHLYDGRCFKAKVMVAEPALDAALLKIEIEEGDDLPYFDITKAAAAQLGQTGDWILAYSNQFEIGTRDDPMSVQRGCIAAYSKLHGRKGVHDAPYQGDVYVIDAITNNPGAGGGAITTRKGELLGMIGKELRNTLTDTWINYAVPVPMLAKFVEDAKAGKYVPKKAEIATSGGGYHGIILVPNVVERTPPYVEDVQPGSPAAQAGLKPDDLIVYVDGEQVASVKAFEEIVDRVRPGTELSLEIRRYDKANGDSGNKLMTVKLKIVEKPKKAAETKK